jgi:AcrR family transcriptional regulator
VNQLATTSRRELNKARTRAAIMKAARTSFAAAGVTGATMDQIAEAAEVSRATLFNYFASKAAIIAALVEQLDTDFIALIESYRQQRMTTADRIVGIFTESARNLEKRGDAVRFLVGISEQSWGDQLGIDRLASLTDAFMSLLSDENAGDVRTDVDVRVLGEMLVSVYIGIIHNWRMLDSYPLETRLHAAAEIIGQAVTEPARKSKRSK